ncbi:MAG: T9SS type A sorting domain-containing protein [Bacteroidota bacterium]
MKKILISSLLMSLICIVTYGQEFSYSMYFEDSLGNKDTLVIGYDINGDTDVILSEFGEENIADTPWDPEFDVRISNRVDTDYYQSSDEPLFHTKKKIVERDCGQDYVHPDIRSYVAIDIKTDNWPVTLSWDSSLFENFCRSKSLFTSWGPETWWDAGQSPSGFEWVLLNEQGQLEFYANYWDNYDDYLDQPVETSGYYIINDSIPIATYWMVFRNPTEATKINDKVNSKTWNIVYPNPTNGSDLINVKDDFGEIEHVKLLNIQGYTVIFQKSSTLDIGHLPNGLYVLEILSKDGDKIFNKVIKN